MTELHSQGRSIQDIEACLQRIMPIDSHIVDAIKSAKSLGYARRRFVFTLKS